MSLTDYAPDTRLIPQLRFLSLRSNCQVIQTRNLGCRVLGAVPGIRYVATGNWTHLEPVESDSSSEQQEQIMGRGPNFNSRACRDQSWSDCVPCICRHTDRRSYKPTCRATKLPFLARHSHNSNKRPPTLRIFRVHQPECCKWVLPSLIKQY